MAKMNFIPTGSRAADIGGLLGSTVGSGLNDLIGHKVNQLQERQGIKRYTDAGYTPEQAAVLATTKDPQTFKALVDRFQPTTQESNIPQDLQSLLAQLSSQGQLPQELQTAQSQPDINQMLQQQQSGNLSFLQPQQQKLNELQQDLTQKQQQPQTTMLGGKPMTEAQRVKAAQEAEKMADKTSEKARKELLPYSQAASLTNTTDDIFKSVLRASQSGQARGGNAQILMNKMGLDEFGRNPTTENLQKDLERLGLGVGKAFGSGMGRILAKEFEVFVKSNLTKFNTPEGMNFIAQIKLIENKLIRERYNKAIEILKNNKNKVPIDFEAKIDQAMDKTNKKYKNQIEELQKILSNNKFLPINASIRDEKTGKYISNYFNPSKWKSGSEIEYNNIPFKLDEGFWQVNLDKYKGK